MKIAPIHKAFSTRQNGHPPADLLLVHTGQHYGRNMPDESFWGNRAQQTRRALKNQRVPPIGRGRARRLVRFRDLGIPDPDIKLEVGSGSHAEQTARINSSNHQFINPRAIIGFEIGETALFHPDNEMRRCCPGVTFHPEIGSIQNRQRLAANTGQLSTRHVVRAEGL
jgi:hypothetical protein